MLKEQKENIKNGQKEIGSLKARVGRERSINREGPDCTVEVYRPEESKE